MQVLESLKQILKSLEQIPKSLRPCDDFEGSMRRLEGGSGGLGAFLVESVSKEGYPVVQYFGSLNDHFVKLNCY